MKKYAFIIILKNLKYDTENVTQNDGQSVGQNVG